jgi:FrmR/RcnR family transcriptional regulator, repressor of frmRAB operon
MHTIKEKKKLIDRVGRVAGQLEALKRALETEQECGEVLRLIAASRGGMNSLMAEVLEGHLREHAFRTARRGSKDAEAAEDVIAVVRSYLK